MLSQFSREGEHKTLADLNFAFPKDAYPVGRLDTDSEGLLLLSSDSRLNHRLLNPAFGHHRSYLAQVEGEIDDDACRKIEEGVSINIKGEKYVSEKCTVKRVGEVPHVPERIPPVRFRKSIPTSWIELTLTEGKNRQVRKMTAAAGFPTLRLIRISIEKLLLDDMQPGDVREEKEDTFYRLLMLRK